MGWARLTASSCQRLLGVPSFFLVSRSDAKSRKKSSAREKQIPFRITFKLMGFENEEKEEEGGEGKGEEEEAEEEEEKRRPKTRLTNVTRKREPDPACHAPKL